MAVDGMAVDEMAVEPTMGAAASSTGEDGGGKKKRFGKIKVGSKSNSIRGSSFLPDRAKHKEKKLANSHPKTLANPSAAPIRAGLDMRKRSGVKKPSAVMRKTLKKMAKARGMEL